MIDLSQAKEIAQKQYPQFRLDHAYDDGSRFIFSYAMKESDAVPYHPLRTLIFWTRFRKSASKNHISRQQAALRKGRGFCIPVFYSHFRQTLKNRHECGAYRVNKA